MEIITLITSIIAASKNTVELVRSAKVRLKGNKEADAILVEIQGAISELQTNLLTLQTEALDLQAENNRLREKIGAIEKRAIEEDKYERKQIANHIVMVVRGGAGPPYFCDNCFRQGNVIQLQEEPVAMAYLVGSHSCPKCGTEFRLRK